MKLTQYSSRNGPTTLTRITRENGTGFILFRLLELKEATKSEVYGYDVQTRSHGTHNYIWAILLNSGLIECSNGYRKPSVRARWDGGYRKCYATYTYKKEPARYKLTTTGEEIAHKL